MLLEVKWSGFDHKDHKLFNHSKGIKTDKKIAKKWRENRKMIQAYLYRIQSRINRGNMEEALFLFNRLIVLIDAPYWMACALTKELTKKS